MYAFINSHLHVQIDSIVRSRPWLNSEFALTRSGDSVFRDICDLVSSEISHMSLLDFKKCDYRMTITCSGDRKR
jgi:hypothetical protein